MDRNDDDEWEIDTDDINSLDSAELKETRPNRWTGAIGTWLTLTEEERQTYAAFQNLRNKDLAAHLYNVFSLKQNNQLRDPARVPQPADVNKETGETIISKVWAPSGQWTAWPMPPGQLPARDFMHRVGVDDDGARDFTFRRHEQVLPSTELTEEICATMLRHAKERFHKRAVQPQDENEDALKVSESDHDTDALSQIDDVKRSSSRAQSDPDDARDSDSVQSNVERGVEAMLQNEPLPEYEPVITIDDEFSYELLRPAAGQILSNLNRTLTVLHNTSVGTASNRPDDEEEEEEEKKSGDFSGTELEQASHSVATVKGDPHDPDCTEWQPHARGQEENENELAVKKSETHLPEEPHNLSRRQKRGPRKTLRTHTRIPKRRKGLAILSKDQALRRDKGTIPSYRWGLRDWKDVLGAAVLAGFSTAVVERAAQRCSNLFKQQMELRSLEEMPAIGLHEAQENELTRFKPGVSLDLQLDDDELPLGNCDQIRSTMRAQSIRVETASYQPAYPALAAFRRRQQAAMGTGRPWFCPHNDCRGAISGYGSRNNLLDHLRKFHADTDEMPSDRQDLEETVGAVHVDGFLKLVKYRTAWDKEKRQALKGKGKKRDREAKLESEDEKSVMDAMEDG